MQLGSKQAFVSNSSTRGKRPRSYPAVPHLFVSPLLPLVTDGMVADGQCPIEVRVGYVFFRASSIVELAAGNKTLPCYL
jgi:hypothetical protein